MHESICELVRKQEINYTGGTPVKHSKYVEIDQWEDINKIEAYINSKHTSGNKDSMDRDKPFFNIVIAARNIWYRATNIARRNIRLASKKKRWRVHSFIAMMLLWDWMKRSDYGSYLKKWGLTLATYGSAVSKFVEQDGQLICSVVPWNILICDPIDFENNLKIEKLYPTPGKLRKNKSYDQEAVRQLLETRQSREDLDGHNKDNRNDYIEVYEVHGELPLSYLTGKESDEDTYVQQMHVVSFVEKKEKNAKGESEYDDFCLYKGRENDPYQLDHLLEEDGKTLSVGAVQYLFEAQWMVNHSVKAIKDQLDLASQLIFQTSDGNYIGRNVLTDIMTGDILIHELNQPLAQVQNNSHDITSLQNFAAQWQVLAKEITSTPDAIRGDTMPAGTAWRQVEALRTESHSLFEDMTQNKGLAIERHMRRFVIPFVKKKMDTAEEIASALDSQDITEFDAMFIPIEAVRRNNEIIKEASLRGEVTAQPNIESIKMGIRQELDELGNNRFLKPSDIPNKTWKEILKDFEWEVEVEVTSENSNKEAVMTTLTTVLQTIASNPMVLQDPNMKMLFNKILEETGAVSSIELSAPAKPATPPQLPGQMQPQLPNQPTQPQTVGVNN